MKTIFIAIGIVLFLIPGSDIRAAQSVSQPQNRFEEFDLGSGQTRTLATHADAVLVVAELKLDGQVFETLTFKPADDGKWDDPQGCVHLRLHYDQKTKTLTNHDFACLGATSNFTFHIYFVYRQ